MSDDRSDAGGDEPSPMLPIERRDVLKLTGAGAVGSAAAIPTVTAESGSTSNSYNVDIRQIARPEFPTVTAYTSVRDSNGDPVTGLSTGDFSVSEDGVTQTITSFDAPASASTSEVSVSLVLDRSGSMAGSKLADAKAAAKDFVDQFNADDEGQIIAFNSSVGFKERWTKQVGELKSAIDDLSASGGTKLWGATQTGVGEAEPRVGRSAVVVLTDGKDRTLATVDDAIGAAQSANVPVYTIGLGSDVNGTDLQRLADETGGVYYFAPSSSDLTTIYNRISQSIADEYEITYETTNTATDGTVRDVSVAASSGGNSGSDTGTYEAPCAPLPTASFSMSPSTPVIGQSASFDGSASSANGGDLVAYLWDFDNNGVTDATGEQATHTYTDPGSYEARLTVEKTCGARDVEVMSFDVSEGDFSLSITSVNDPITAGETLEVDATVTNISTEKQTSAVFLDDIFGNRITPAATVDLDPGESTDVTLEWNTEPGDAGTGDVMLSIGNVTSTATVEVEQAGGFVQAKSEKRDLVAEIGDLSANLDEQSEVDAVLSDLTASVDGGSIPETDAEGAVERLSFGESATKRALQVSGPAATPNDVSEMDLTKRMVQIPVDIGTSLILSKLALKKRLASKLNVIDPSNFDNLDSDEVDKLLELIGGIDFSGLAKEVAGLMLPDEEVNAVINKCTEIAEDILDQIDEGILQTGEDIKGAIEDSYSGFLEEVAARTLRPLLENGRETPMEFLDIAGLDDDLSRLNAAVAPTEVQAGLDGSLSGAEDGMKQGNNNIDEHAENTKSWMDDIDAAADYFTLLGHIPTVLDWLGNLGDQSESQGVESQVVTIGAVISAVLTIETTLSTIGTVVQGSGAVVGLYGLWELRQKHGGTIDTVIAGDPDPGLLAVDESNRAFRQEYRGESDV